MASNSKKQDVFRNEMQILEELKKVLNQGDVSNELFREKYQILCDKYERLLGEAKFLTSVSDRLQSKLNVANETLTKQSDEINTINNDLTVNNQILQDTIDQLVKARVGRKATSIVLFFAIILFIISEGLLEPIVEENVDSQLVGFMFKGGIALLLKPIDTLVERYLMRQNLKKKDQSLKHMESAVITND